MQILSKLHVMIWAVSTCSATRTILTTLHNTSPYLIVDEVVYLLQGSAVQFAGKGLKLSGQHGSILYTQLATWLETIILD